MDYKAKIIAVVAGGTAALGILGTSWQHACPSGALAVDDSEPIAAGGPVTA